MPDRRRKTLMMALMTCLTVFPSGQRALRAEVNDAPAKEDKKKNPSENAEAISAWRTDLAAFEAFLRELSTTSRTPTPAEFAKRLRIANETHNREVEVITDGAGGVVDYKPDEDTVQFRVNEALKGKTVRWEFELGQDASYSGQVGLTPVGVPEAVVAGSNLPFFTSIYFKEHQANLPATELRKGQRIVFQGRIGDTQDNHHRRSSFNGATAVYYLEEIPHPIFWIGFEEVTINRVAPSEDQLAASLLSDKPNINRQRWTVLDENNRAGSKRSIGIEAIDGEKSSVWRSTAVPGQSQVSSSLLVDMGAAQTVTGIRYVSPPAEQTGTLGRFKLYVSDSPTAMGKPVAVCLLTGYGVEREVSFAEVEGRYFRLTPWPTNDPTSLSIAEVNLVGSEIQFAHEERAPRLPPLAEEIERYWLLRQTLREPSLDLSLSPAQRTKWDQAVEQIKSRWYYRNGMVLSELIDSKRWSAIARTAAKKDLSNIEEANFYAVAASPQFSDAALRNEMKDISKLVRQSRLHFLGEIKRILSSDQQVKLRDVIATVTKPRRIGGP